MQPKVSLITVNYNQTAVTCDLLESIERQDYKNVEVIVVDNASVENPALEINSRFPGTIFIRSAQNLGFAGGNNLGVAEASGDYLFFINNDTELLDGCIARLVVMFEHIPNLGAASPLICYFPERNMSKEIIQYAGMTPVHRITARNETLGNRQENQGQFNTATPTAYMHGAAMMIPRQVLETVGPMADDFFLYYEELDWGERIRRAGYEIWVEPNAKIYHKESLTVAKMGALKTYFLNRNRVYFMRRNYSGIGLGLFFVFLTLITVPKNVLLYAVKGDWKNLSAFLKGIWWNVMPQNNQFEQLLPKQTKEHKKQLTAA